MQFTLRPWSISGVDNLVLYANNASIPKFMNDSFPHQFSKESGKAFIAFTNQNNSIHIFAIDLKGSTIGGYWYPPKK